MKGIVNCYLNVRTSWPGVNAPNPYYLKPGSEIDIEAEVEGEDVEQNGNKRWYRLNNGVFVWSGGVDVSSAGNITMGHILTVSESIDYSQAMQTANELPVSTGGDVVIGIVDTGVIKHKALTSVKNSSNESLHPHGTNMAGMIGANSVQLKGLSFGSALFAFKSCDNQGITDMNLLKESLRSIRAHEPPIDLVNLSLSISDYDVIKPELEALNNAGTILVAAGGDERTFKHNRVAAIGQKNDFVISVGAIRDSNYLIEKGLVPQRLNVLYVDVRRKTTTIRPNSSLEYEEAGGDSLYTALTTGAIARFISVFKKNHQRRPDRNDVVQFIQNISFSLSGGAIINTDLKPLKL